MYQAHGRPGAPLLPDEEVPECDHRWQSTPDVQFEQETEEQGAHDVAQAAEQDEVFDELRPHSQCRFGGIIGRAGHGSSMRAKPLPK